MATWEDDNTMQHRTPIQGVVAVSTKDKKYTPLGTHEDNNPSPQGTTVQVRESQVNNKEEECKEIIDLSGSGPLNCMAEFQMKTEFKWDNKDKSCEDDIDSSWDEPTIQRKMELQRETKDKSCEDDIGSP